MNQLAYPRLVQTSLSLPGGLTDSDAEHHAVLAMISARDGVNAERLMRQHVGASLQALLDTLTFTGDDPPSASAQQEAR